MVYSIARKEKSFRSRGLSEDSKVPPLVHIRCQAQKSWGIFMPRPVTGDLIMLEENKRIEIPVAIMRLVEDTETKYHYHILCHITRDETYYTYCKVFVVLRQSLAIYECVERINRKVSA